jgi:hypothetical protein
MLSLREIFVLRSVVRANNFPFPCLTTRHSANLGFRCAVLTLVAVTESMKMQNLSSYEPHCSHSPVRILRRMRCSRSENACCYHCGAVSHVLHCVRIALMFVLHMYLFILLSLQLLIAWKLHRALYLLLGFPL